MIDKSQPMEQRQLREQALVLSQLGYHFGIPTELADLEDALHSVLATESSGSLDGSPIEPLCEAGLTLGLRLASSKLSYADAYELLDDGYPVVTQWNNGSQTGWVVLLQPLKRRYEARFIHDGDQVESVDSNQLSASWGDARVCYVAQTTQPCDKLSTAPAYTQSGRMTANHDHAAHGHMKPLTRLIAMLKLDGRDIITLILFSAVTGLTSLATPLAVESLVNTVAWGTYLQPLLVLSALLLGFLAFGGFLRVLQNVVAEVLQQRIFVRIVGDLSNRFALANRESLVGEYPEELSNRYFDIMTIQKATASLLLDGIAIVLATMIGLVLLAFYHPFLLGFDIVLIFSMTLITYLLGRGGVKSAIAESKIKYRIGHWLQDILSRPTAFRLHGGAEYSVDRANRLTVEYLMARRAHFRVLLRQFTFALALQAIASTALLGVGGWLVIRGELTLGQLVASELVVTAIVGAFAKIGKSLESYYDLLAAVDKVGHLLDTPIDPISRAHQAEVGPAAVRWNGLSINVSRDGRPASEVEIQSGQVVAVSGNSGTGKTWLLEVLAGLRHAAEGYVEIGSLNASEVSAMYQGKWVGLATQPEIFCGELLENVRLGRGWVNSAEISAALELVGLKDDVLKLDYASSTNLESNGYPLSYGQQVRLMIARAIVGQPRVLLIDGILDCLPPEERFRIFEALVKDRDKWTLIIVTHDRELIRRCDMALQLSSRS